MNPIKVPIVPQWNISSGCACTPNGGLLYIGAKSINYICRISTDGGNDEMQFKTFHTRQPILSVDVDPGWPCQNDVGEKLFAVLAQDSSVQIWNFDKEQVVSGHKAHYTASQHMNGNGPFPTSDDRAYLNYMCNRNVLSMNSCEIVVYCVASNTYIRLKSFGLPKNHQITTLRCATHNENIFAVGTNRGLILIYDLQQTRVIYTLRGHDKAITSLSWNMFALKLLDAELIATKKIKIKPKTKSKNTSSCSGGGARKKPDDEEIFDIYDFDYLENEFGTPFKSIKKGANSGDYGNDSEFVGIEIAAKCAGSTKFDFIEACQNLKEEIVALSRENSSKQSYEEVTIDDCIRIQKQLPSSCGYDDVDDAGNADGNVSAVESLELVENRSSDSSSFVADGGSEWQPMVQTLHAEVHAPHDEKQTKTQNLVPEKKKTENKNCHLSEYVLKKLNLNGESMDILLLSASLDGTLCIWNAKTGTCLDNLHISVTKTGKNNHIQIAWLNEGSFFANNNKGYLSYWKLKTPQKNLNEKQQLMRYKYKEEKCNIQEFNVVSFGLCKATKLLWCISSLRELSCFDLEQNKRLAKYGCASTNISVIKECPDNMNKIALGFSDHRVGIIDISQITTTNITIENYSQRIDSAVLSLVWSPDSKMLAFGTIQGRIGIIKTEQTKQQPFLFNVISGKPIYSIDWQDNEIFVVCNEILAVYNANMQHKDGDVILGIEKVSAVSARKNFLFVGTQDGHLQIYKRNLNADTRCYDVIYAFHVTQRYISEISWSRIVETQFAIVGNSNCFFVLNFDWQKEMVVDTNNFEIKNKKASITSIRWSNVNEHNFLTTGFDGAIRIWDLKTEKNEEKFIKNYHCPMFCGIFLPDNENIVMCGGKTTSLEFFDMRLENSGDGAAHSKRTKTHQQTYDSVQWAQKAQVSNANEKSNRNRRLEKSTGNLNKMKQHNIEVKSAETCNAKPDEDITNLMNQLVIKVEKNIENANEIVAEAQIKNAANSDGVIAKENVPIYMKHVNTLLYLTTKELNKDTVKKIELLLSDADDSDENKGLSSKLFGTRDEALTLLNEELKNYRDSEAKGISNLLLPQMNCSLKDEILRCIKKSELNEWHISLAPTISYSFWKNCCIAYSEQLLEQGYVLQAATYKLAIHNQYDTIKLLCSKNYFKEALLLARIYLEAGDPLISEITEKWINNLIFVGNFTAASLLQILEGKKSIAFETLSRIRNPTPEIEKVLQLLKSKSL